MKVIAGGKRAANPYAAIAAPYLQQFYKSMIQKRGGTAIEIAFNKFTPAERKAIFVLGNARADSWPGKMAKLGHEQIEFNYSQFSDQEKLTLISGMRSLKELSERIPYSRPGEEAAARLMAQEDGEESKQEEEMPISSVNEVTEISGSYPDALGF